MVDLSAGRIVAVIISSGGYIGLGDELSAVPPTALRFNANMTPSSLTPPRICWPIHRTSRPVNGPISASPVMPAEFITPTTLTPWFNPAATTEADNTRQIVRDRDSSTLTTLDQGNSQGGVNTAAQIRSEIIADSRMSVNARNVKITAIDGRVILCGPVNSAEEKRLIGEIADRIAHAGNVDNQLEVQFTTSRN
jgi:hypothetical protein